MLTELPLPGAGSVAADAPADNYRIGGTHLHTPPSPDGREHKLLVGVPYRYDNEPGRRYPILYLCDGYWDFMVILGLYGPLWADRAIDEFIIVGLAYGSGYPDAPGIKDRTRDLSPGAEDTLSNPHTAAARYLAAITGTFAPYIEARYRADVRRRVIAGSSIGGAFALCALLRQPTFFSGAIALSPCLSLGNSAAPRCEKEFYLRQTGGARWRWSRRRPALPARLFMAVGGADDRAIVEPARAFNRTLTRRGYAGLANRFWVAPEETHATVKAEGFNRGLRWVFGPAARSAPALAR